MCIDVLRWVYGRVVGMALDINVELLSLSTPPPSFSATFLFYFDSYLFIVRCFFPCFNLHCPNVSSLGYAMEGATLKISISDTCCASCELLTFIK